MIYQNLHDVNSLFYNGHEITQVIRNNNILFDGLKKITGVLPLTLNARNAGAATSYKLMGKAHQNGTPMPDIILTADDAFKVINGYISYGTEIVAEDDNRILVYKLEPNTKYHISLEKQNRAQDDIVYSFASKEPNIGDTVIRGDIYPAYSGSVSYSFDITTDSTHTWFCLKLCKVSITDFDLAWNSVKIVRSKTSIEIKGVGDNVLSADKAFKVINGYLAGGTRIVAADDNRILVYNLEPNTKYHISLEKNNSSSDDIVYSFASKEPNVGDTVILGKIYSAVSGYVSYSFDITTDSTNTWLCLKLCSIKKTDFDLAWNSFKIAGGNYRATITSNGAISATIYLNSPLYGTGDVLDEYDSTGKIVRKWGVYVFDGTENWQTLWGVLSLPNQISAITTPRIQTLICDRYIAKINLTQAQGYPSSYGNNSITFRDYASTILIRDDTFGTDTASFKAYLAAQYAAGTPMTIIYQLATPIEETITAPPLVLTKGTNIIDIDTTVKPTSMTITYK